MGDCSHPQHAPACNADTVNALFIIREPGRRWCFTTVKSLILNDFCYSIRDRPELVLRNLRHLSSDATISKWLVINGQCGSTLRLRGDSEQKCTNSLAPKPRWDTGRPMSPLPT